MEQITRQNVAIAGAGILACIALYHILKPRPQHILTDKHFNDENLVSYANEAEQRAKQISDVSYKLMITLGKTIEEGFSGSLETRFALSGTHDVYLDF
jgi:hypothetical protein